MTLDKGKKGMNVRILHIPDNLVRVQIIRFGIMEGAVIRCEEVIPAGPIVVSNNRQEIAIGRKLAEKIEVEQITA